jgi:EVE domain
MSNHWIFQTNPKRYAVHPRLREGLPDEIKWTVRQHRDQVKKGDFAFLWACKGGEPHAGLCGFVEVLCDPIEQDDSTFEKKEFWKESTRSEYRVNCRVVVRNWITKEEMLASKPELGDLPNLRQPQGTNYLLTDRQLTLLKQLMGIS